MKTSSEYVFEQKISEELLSEFNDNNEYHINIDVNAAGYAEHAITVGESGYTNSIKNNDVFVGKVLSVTYADLKLDAITLSFSLNNDVIMQSTDVLYDELKGINRFQVVRMNSDNNMLEPVKTEIDNSTLIVEVTQTGDYCILDVSKLLSQYGVEVSSNISSYSLKSANRSSSPLEGPVDVVFMVDCSGTNTEDVFRNYLKEIEIASEDIFEKCYDARISIIQFSNSARKVTFSNGEEWASNIAQVRELLSKLQYIPSCTVSYYGRAQGVMFNSTKFRDDAVRFGFSIFSPISYSYTGGDRNVAKMLLEKDIKWGYVCGSHMTALDDMYMEIDYGTTMIYNSYSRSFGSDLADAVYNTTVDSVTPYIVLGCDLKKVKLVGPLSKNSSRDTDGDGLSDSQEINWTEYETLKYKNVYNFLANSIQSSVLNHLSDDEQEKLKRYKLYPAYSNPTMADSDGDGFFDGIEGKYEPTGYYKVADKWPLTDKPHPAFYQKGGEYYFYSLKHSETPKNIQFLATEVGGDLYTEKGLNLSEDEQKYIYKLCTIVNNDDNFSDEISPLLIMAICAHETSCESVFNWGTDVSRNMGYMQTDYVYLNKYCTSTDGWLKEFRSLATQWSGISQKDYDILAEKASRANEIDNDKNKTKPTRKNEINEIIKEDENFVSKWLKDNSFVNIMFGTAFLYEHCKGKNMWMGLRNYCTYYEKDDKRNDEHSPWEDTYYTEILAKLIDEEMPYEKDEPYKNSPDYHILIDGIPVPLKLPQ